MVHIIYQARDRVTINGLPAIKLLSTVPALSGEIPGEKSSTSESLQSGPSNLCWSIMTDACATSSMGSLTRYRTCINLHCKNRKKEKISFSRFLSGGWMCAAAVSWFVASELCRVRVHALRSDVQFVKCSIKDTFLLLLVDRVAPIQAQRADSLGRAMQIEFNAAVNRIWGWFTMLVASQVFVAVSYIVDLLSLADDCFIIWNA